MSVLMMKKVFLMSSLNLTCFNLRRLSLILLPCTTVKGLAPTVNLLIGARWRGYFWVLLKLILLKAEEVPEKKHAPSLKKPMLEPLCPNYILVVL